MKKTTKQTVNPIGFKNRNSNIQPAAAIHTGGLPLSVGYSIGVKVAPKKKGKGGIFNEISERLKLTNFAVYNICFQSFVISGYAVRTSRNFQECDIATLSQCIANFTRDNGNELMSSDGKNAILCRINAENVPYITVCKIFKLKKDAVKYGDSNGIHCITIVKTGEIMLSEFSTPALIK